MAPVNRLQHFGSTVSAIWTSHWLISSPAESSHPAWRLPENAGSSWERSNDGLEFRDTKWVTEEMKTLGATSASELEKRIARYPALRNLRGLKTQESQARFAEKLFKSEKKLRALSMRRFAGSPDLSREDFHPLKAIVKAFEAGDRDESIWLACLFTHFGWDPRLPRFA